MSEQPVSQDKMLDKIRKMLALAQNPGATQGEADMFFAKAAELAAKYGIDEAMLTAADPTRDEVGDRIITVYGPYIRERSIFLQALAKELGVRGLQRPSAKGQLDVHLFGYGSDLNRVEILFTSLLLQAGTGMVRAERDRDAHSVMVDTIRVFRRSWLLGFMSTVLGRVREMEARARQQADQARTAAGGTGPSTELVLVDRKAVVDRRFTDAYPSTRSVRPAAAGSRSGYNSGQAAGRTADLGQSRVSSGPRAALSSR